MLTARHGRDALLVAERYERPIDLLVTDVVMPEMGGGELVERLTARRPDLKMLYISGYTNDEVLRRGVQGAETSFLHKPFTSDGLMRRGAGSAGQRSAGDYLTRARRFLKMSGLTSPLRCSAISPTIQCGSAPGALVAWPGRRRCWSSRISLPWES